MGPDSLRKFPVNSLLAPLRLLDDGTPLCLYGPRGFSTEFPVNSLFRLWETPDSRYLCGSQDCSSKISCFFPCYLDRTDFSSNKSPVSARFRTNDRSPRLHNSLGSSRGRSSRKSACTDWLPQKITGRRGAIPLATNGIALCNRYGLFRNLLGEIAFHYWSRLRGGFGLGF